MREGEGSGQHGEDRILKLVFRDQPAGLLVDVGAADGFWNSNSIMLLQRPGWKGVLIEPEPSQFQLLQDRYRDNPNVVCRRIAIGRNKGPQTLWCGGQVSTFDPEVKRSAEVNHGINYTETTVEMMPLSEQLMEEGVYTQEIDFMSIDVEGMNYEAWLTLDTTVHFPKLVCIEGTGYRMDGYKQLCRLGSNTFYLREDLCDQL